MSSLRREYSGTPFVEESLAPTWWEQFERWFDDARVLGEPNAMVLATAGADGRPRARTVLLKAHGPEGFVWATNYDSRKGVDLAAHPFAGLCFPWHDLQRQVQAEGPVERLSATESDAIWRNRPRPSQLSAAASAQSAVIASRGELEARIAELDGRLGDPVPRPENWGGYRLRPDYVEFWQGQRDRLHDRLRFRRSSPDPQSEQPGQGWTVERLSP